MYRPSPQRQQRQQQQQRLSNELHDEAFDISSSNGTTPMDTPQGYLASHMMMNNNNNNNNRIPRPSSPTPTSSDYTTETETETEGDDEYQYHHHHQSTRPASPPSKQPSVPRAHSSRPAPDFVSPAGARQALEELDESMDQLCDNFPDTASSTVNSALNEVCDKLELLSEIVLSHERRLKSAEQQQVAAASPSPFAQPVHDGVSSPGYVHQAESNRALVNSILSKVDAVEAMMQQHVSSSPQQHQQQQQQSVRSPLAPLSSPADLKMTMAAMNNSNQENITPARSEASQVIAATVESAMKSISRQLAKQNELLAQVVVSSAAASQQRRGPSPSSAYQQTPYGSDENEDPLAQSTTASIADECSPQGAELSPRRERTPEALKVTQQESAQRQREARHVDPSHVVPPARLYEEYAYSGTEESESDYTTETDETEPETEQEEDSNISVNNVQEDDGAYYYDRIHQQKKLHENSYNVPFVGAGADIVSVTSSQFEEEVADEDEVDNASPRRAMYGAVDSVATIRAMSTSPARNRGTIQAPVAVVFESDDDETETETETDEEEDLHQQPSIACTDTEDDEEQVRVAEHFSPSRRTPQAYRTTEAEVARRDEEELVATLRAKQETQAYLEEAIMRSSERRRREQYHQSSASSSPASRASTASRHQQEDDNDDDHPSTGRHPNESLLVEVEGLTPQPAYLLRSAIRNDAESAEKLPEKRALFTEDIEEDDNESEMTQEEDFVSVQKTSTTATPSDMSYVSEAPSNNNNRVSNIYETLMMQQQQQQQQPASETSSVFSQQSATTIPNDLLQTVIDELHRLRSENASLKNQLDWALKRTDAVSERLLELSPCK